MESTLNLFVNLAQLITGIIGICAFIFSFHQLKVSRITKKFEFILSLREIFNEQKKFKIHEALRNGHSIPDWASLDEYLGVFEICEVMIHNKILDTQIFSDLYKYRLQNILSNEEIILNKLILEVESWDNLYKLFKRIFPEINKSLDNIKLNSNELFRIYSNQLYSIPRDNFLDNIKEREIAKELENSIVDINIKLFGLESND
ncbi:hypothetical protein CH372_19615 [Leptospira meyeri]|uniref:hypothetical protein n=1 Tax=Leptospira meyeri TaxID=29508 RepID=UPI000C2B05DD|nr:hypothetical protein [Leptospira meyeri]PKA10399.1 hypothetical protein CH372_19615 [Leptospira meyeri]